MKRSVLCSTVVLAVFSANALRAQDLSGISRLPESSPAAMNGNPIQPLLGVSPEAFSKDREWYVTQDPTSLATNEAPTTTHPWSLESQLRQNASPFLKISSPKRTSGLLAMASQGPAKELSFALSLLAAIYRQDATPSNTADDSSLEFALNIRTRIRQEPSKVREIVATEVNANPKRVCEIVKAAIKATDGEPETVASIVEVAAISSPESMRLAAQCALAVSPESLDAVQLVLSKIDPATGNLGRDAKDAKDAKDAEVAPAFAPANPLDLPPLPPPLPPVTPPPPQATNPNFRL